MRAWGERDNRGWDGWMASTTQWTWVWANSRGLWRTRKPDMLQSMGSQTVWHNWATEQQIHTVEYYIVHKVSECISKDRFQKYNVEGRKGFAEFICVIYIYMYIIYMYIMYLVLQNVENYTQIFLYILIFAKQKLYTYILISMYCCCCCC